MKRIFAALALVCALALPGSASAEGTGMYLAPKFLMTMQNLGTVEHSGLGGFGIDNYSQFTLGGALAAGYDFWPQHMIPLRIELEGALRGNSERSWTGARGECKETFNSTTLLANVYYDFHNSSAFTPYVGAGLGFAFNYLGVDVHDRNGNSIASQDERQTNLAWNVGLGAAYQINDNMAIDAGYRYVDFGYTEVEGSSPFGSGSVGIRPYAHELSLGLRWGF
ncbi:MAG: porin family protein [Desulfovibrio sp.]|nr:porin family protein [Desulfovibrio sp.]